MVLLLFSGEVNHILVLQVNHTILHLAVRSLDESELIDLCIDAER